MNVAHPPGEHDQDAAGAHRARRAATWTRRSSATEADTQVECNCAGVEPGRTYTARQLLEALLLVSGNDAANALADMIGGYDAAVAKMNAKAASIGALGTHAATPSGLDGPGIDGCTTPHDLAVIFRAAMANPVFAQIIAQPAATFPTATGDEAARQPGRAAAPLSRHARRQDRLHRRARRRRSSPPPTATAADWWSR